MVVYHFERISIDRQLHSPFDKSEQRATTLCNGTPIQILNRYPYSTYTLMLPENMNLE